MRNISTPFALLLLIVYIVPSAHLVASHDKVPRHGESNGWHRRSDRHEDLQPMHPKVMAVAESAFSSEAEVSVAATASASAPTRAAKEAEEAHKKRRVEVEEDELEDERSKETVESYQGDQAMGPTAGVLRKTEDAGPTLGAQPKQLWFSNFEEFQRLTEPAFDNNTVSNVTVQLGGTAFLHCRVRNLGERTVSGAEISWIRRRDWHILTSGLFTYTNDERFQVLHAEGSDDWTLQIKYVQKRDNGTYECQVSTGTGIMSHFVNVHIVVPEAFILGTGDHHVDIGSAISLVCIIEKSPSPPQYVFWYHNERMINYDTSRGGITVETEPGPKTHSRLTIRDASDADSGNYTCSASNTEPASIHVFVSEADKMAAILPRKTTTGSGASAIVYRDRRSRLVDPLFLICIVSFLSPTVLKCVTGG